MKGDNGFDLTKRCNGIHVKNGICTGDTTVIKQGGTGMKKVVAILVALCMLFSAVALAEGSGSRKVYAVWKNLTNPALVTMKEGAEAAAKEFNIDLTVLSPLEADNSEEINQLVEQSIAAGDADAIIIFPADSTSAIPAAEKVVEAGIPLVNLNTKINSDEPLYQAYVCSSNYKVGYEIGKKLADTMESGELILIEGVSGAQNSLDRCAGCTDAVNEHGGIEIVASQAADMNRATAMNVAQNLLQAYPNVKAFFCCNDEEALGVAEAVKAAGKMGEIIITGCDVNKDARQAIKEGIITYSCDVNVFDQGYYAVKSCAMILDGETPELEQVVDVKVVGIDEIDEYMQ